MRKYRAMMLAIESIIESALNHLPDLESMDYRAELDASLRDTLHSIGTAIVDVLEPETQSDMPIRYRQRYTNVLSLPYPNDEGVTLGQGLSYNGSIAQQHNLLVMLRDVLASLVPSHYRVVVEDADGSYLLDDSTGRVVLFARRHAQEDTITK